MSPSPATPKIQHHVPTEHRRRTAWIVGGVVLAALASFGFGLYRYGWHGGCHLTFAPTLHPRERQGEGGRAWGEVGR